MRITYITRYFYPHVGGIETVVRNISSRVASKGHEVNIITRMDRNTRPNEQVENVDIKRIKSFGNFFKIFHLCKDADIIHVHGALTPSILILMLKNNNTIFSLHGWSHICPKDVAFRPEERSVCYYHFPGIECLTCNAPNANDGMNERASLTNILYSALNRLLLARSQVITVPSESLRRVYVKSLRRNDIKVIPGGVDVEKFDNIDSRDSKILKEMGIDGSSVILFVGRLRWIKGVRYLIEAATKINGDFKVVIVGNGPDFFTLRQLAEKLEIEDRVIFAGMISEDRLLRLYKACDMVAVPSIWEEPFGIVALEAMSAGKPVVASCVGALPEFVEDGKTGFLVDPRDSNQLAEVLEMLISDGKLRRDLGKAGCEKAKMYRWDKIADTYLEIYESIYQMT